MNIRHLELAGSLDLQSMLRKLDDAQMLDFAEYRILHDCAESKLDQLLRKLGGQPELEQLREAGIHLSHLLQVNCLALRRVPLDREGKLLARQALEYQVACIQAALRRSLAHFGDA